MSNLPDAATLSGVASVISAFGAAMLLFRIQRENEMREKDELVWLPLADWLLVGATTFCLLLVIVPIVSFAASTRLPAAAAGTAAILVAGYLPAIMAHYRIVFIRKGLFWGAERKGPRCNPEPAERILVWMVAGAAILYFLWRLMLAPGGTAT